MIYYINKSYHLCDMCVYVSKLHPPFAGFSFTQSGKSDFQAVMKLRAFR